jgi:hypothetical protein
MRRVGHCFGRRGLYMRSDERSGGRDCEVELGRRTMASGSKEGWRIKKPDACCCFENAL